MYKVTCSILNEFVSKVLVYIVYSKLIVLKLVLFMQQKPTENVKEVLLDGTWLRFLGCSTAWEICNKMRVVWHYAMDFLV